MNKPWKLSGLEYAILFGHRIAKGVVANDNTASDAPSDEVMREALQNATSHDATEEQSAAAFQAPSPDDSRATTPSQSAPIMARPRMMTLASAP